MLGLVLWCGSCVSFLVYGNHLAQRKRELVALLRVLCLFLAVHTRLQCLIVAFPGYTHLLFGEEQTLGSGL